MQNVRTFGLFENFHYFQLVKILVVLAKCFINVGLADFFDCDGHTGELMGCTGNPAEASLANVLTHVILTESVPIKALSYEYASMPKV